MKQYFTRDFVLLGGILLVLIAISAVAPSRISGQDSTQSKKSPEIEKILALKSTKEQSVELINLMERVGPEQAQEEMLRSGLPFTGETHLLIHYIGNFVYDEYGKDGLAYCKDYFLSACYHAVILNTLGDNGLPGVAEAMKKCEEVGRSIVASQCAHGAGHGFVAWHDYDLLKGVEMCDELGAQVERFAYFNCYDGAFMENIWGVHNGAPSPKRWVKADDIYYPCTDPRIPRKYLNGCWSNQATLIYQLYQGDLRKTALACDGVAETDFRQTCYNNFSRQIHPLTLGSVEKVKELCSFATGESWRDYCILTNMTSYWSVGDRNTPYKICDSLAGQLADKCFTNLSHMIPYYFPNPEERNYYCQKLSSKIHRTQCLEQKV
jgi:hypothetical protein